MDVRPREARALRVTVLELPARWAAREAALDEVDELVRRGPPTDLVVLPELCLTGYVSPAGDFDVGRFAEPIDGPTVSAGARLAERHRVHLALPLVLAESGRIYNSLVLLSPEGTALACYKKRHPWFPERWATPGEAAPPLVTIGGLVVTTAICFDGHFLAYDAADVLRRADLLLFTSAWVDDEDSRLPLLRSLARTFRVSVANANWGGSGVVEVPGQGGSCVLDPTGRLLAAVRPGERRADAGVRASS